MYAICEQDEWVQSMNMWLWVWEKMLMFDAAAADSRCRGSLGNVEAQAPIPVIVPRNKTETCKHVTIYNAFYATII